MVCGLCWQCVVGFDEIWCYVLVLWARVFVVCGGVYWRCVALCIGSVRHVVLCGVKYWCYWVLCIDG